MASSSSPLAAPLLAGLSFLSEQAASTERQPTFLQTAHWGPSLWAGKRREQGTADPTVHSFIP